MNRREERELLVSLMRLGVNETLAELAGILLFDIYNLRLDGTGGRAITSPDGDLLIPVEVSEEIRGHVTKLWEKIQLCQSAN